MPFKKSKIVCQADAATLAALCCRPSLAFPWAGRFTKSELGVSARHGFLKILDLGLPNVIQACSIQP
jgi:hypothetical protein